MSNFNAITTTLGRGITASAKGLESKFVTAITKAAEQAPEGMVAGKVLSEAGAAYVNKFANEVFSGKGKARAAWDSAGFAGSTWRAYKARSKPALAAMLVKLPEAKGEKSLAKLAKAGDALTTKHEGNAKGGKVSKSGPVMSLTAEQVAEAVSLLKRMPKSTAKLAYGAQLATFLRSLPGVERTGK